MTVGSSQQVEPWMSLVRLVLLPLLSTWFLPLSATELVEWRNVPIPVVLNVGDERVLAFPDHVQVGVPPTLTPDRFRTQSTGGTVLWLANEPFEIQRLQVRLLSTGHVMLFDVTAVERQEALPSEPIRVSFPESASNPQADAGKAREQASALTPVTLTRFAAQQLYAPQRLLRDVAGIRRVPMGSPERVFLYRSDQVNARPLGSWQGAGLYVTAVKLENQGTERIDLDPRALRGRFVTATFQHNVLGPAGSRADTTCVYLVTDRPFIASVFQVPRGTTPVTKAGD